MLLHRFFHVENGPVDEVKRFAMGSRGLQSSNIDQETDMLQKHTKKTTTESTICVCVYIYIYTYGVHIQVYTLHIHIYLYIYIYTLLYWI